MVRMKKSVCVFYKYQVCVRDGDYVCMCVRVCGIYGVLVTCMCMCCVVAK